MGFSMSADVSAKLEALTIVPPQHPLVGKVIVPGVAPDNRLPGEATLFDCLFSDNW